MHIEHILTERGLSPTNIDLADFVINPYKGCAIGCTYCYARSNKAIRKIREVWGEYVFVKENLPELLRKEIEKHSGIKRILLGSTTEVFQPIEKELGLTRSILKILKDNNIPVVILTKSNNILSCLELLTYHPSNKIYFTYNSERVRELYEKRSYSQNERLEAIEQIHKSGIDLTVYISPVFPFLTEVPVLLNELNGKTQKVSFEAYSQKLGNWSEIIKKMDKATLEEYTHIYGSKTLYDKYWNNFIKLTNEENKKYHFEINYFIYPFDSYYNG